MKNWAIPVVSGAFIAVILKVVDSFTDARLSQWLWQNIVADLWPFWLAASVLAIYFLVHIMRRTHELTRTTLPSLLQGHAKLTGETAALLRETRALIDQEAEQRRVSEERLSYRLSMLEVKLSGRTPPAS